MSEQRQREQRFTRSGESDLSEEASEALAQEARSALGSDGLDVAPDEPLDDTPAVGTSMRPIFFVTLFAALTFGAIVSLATGSWWAVIAAAGVHALGTMAVVFGAIRLTTQTEHVSPGTAAVLESEGVADPDQALTNLVERASGRGRTNPTAGVVSAGDTASGDPAGERRAITPGYPAGGDGSAVALLPWLVVAGVVVIALGAAILLGGSMWLGPAVIVPLGALWIVMDRYLAGRHEQHAAAGPGRLWVVGAGVVGAVIIFVALMSLATDWGG